MFSLFAYLAMMLTPYHPTASPGIQIGLATTYWPGDGHCGSRRADGYPFHAHDDHIASRTLALGSHVLICNLENGRCTETRVRDRGPFGFCRWVGRGRCPGRGSPTKAMRGCPRGYRYEVRLYQNKRCGFYRGVVDATKPVSRALGLRGMSPVMVYVLPRIQKPADARPPET